MKKILNMSDGLYNFLKIKFYPKTNVILAHLDNTAAGTYAGGSNSLYILKYDKPNTKSHFRDDEVSTKNDFDLDETKKSIYYTTLSTAGMKIVRRTSPDYGYETFSMDSDTEGPSRLIVNPKNGNIFLICKKRYDYFLYHISL